MPEYVYALHDFTPENPDEVPFKAGDKIEVIEKDEQYQDGWWQVCSPTVIFYAARRARWRVLRVVLPGGLDVNSYDGRGVPEESG